MQRDEADAMRLLLPVPGLPFLLLNFSMPIINHADLFGCPRLFVAGDGGSGVEHMPRLTALVEAEQKMSSGQQLKP